MKVVFDTNVLYASLISRQGLCASLVAAGFIRFTIIVSEHILEELHRHLTANRKLNAAQVEAAIQLIRDASEIVTPEAVAGDSCRDPDDLPVLGTAAAGHADFIVTGDQDLLVLQTFGNIEIVSPRTFHDRFVGIV